MRIIEIDNPHYLFLCCAVCFVVSFNGCLTCIKLLLNDGVIMLLARRSIILRTMDFRWYAFGWAWVNVSACLGKSFMILLLRADTFNS